MMVLKFPTYSFVDTGANMDTENHLLTLELMRLPGAHSELTGPATASCLTLLTLSLIHLMAWRAVTQATAADLNYTDAMTFH